MYLLAATTVWLTDAQLLTVVVLASMGASTFLLFVVPNSPMAQPWPMLGGHLIAAVCGVLAASHVPAASLALALAIGLAVLLMYLFKALHPPAAATAIIAVLGGEVVGDAGWQFVYQIVIVNAGILLLLAIVLNKLIPGRNYPTAHQHHPHHQQFISEPHAVNIPLSQADFSHALGQMDTVIDISEEDLLDLYEFALEHAETRYLRGRSGN